MQKSEPRSSFFPSAAKSCLRRVLSLSMLRVSTAL